MGLDICNVCVFDTGLTVSSDTNIYHELKGGQTHTSGSATLYLLGNTKKSLKQ